MTLTTILLVFGVGTAFAQDSLVPPTLYEDPTFNDFEIIVGDPSNYTISADIGEPYIFTYTITDFQNTFRYTDEDVEVMMAEVFADWGQFIPNVDFVYVKDADPANVFGHIKMNHYCGDGLGCGGGEGPNTYCFAANRSGSFIDVNPNDGKIRYNLRSIMSHEVGHCLGLGHITGLNNFDCMMRPNYQSYVSHCNEEVNRLKLLWDDAVCAIPECLVGQEVKLDLRVASAGAVPNPATEGDLVEIVCSITNDGNIQSHQPPFIYDWTDRRQIGKLGGAPSFLTILPGETAFCEDYFLDTAGFGNKTHLIGVHYPIQGDETVANNFIRFNLYLNGSAPPPPPDFCPTANCDDGNMCTIDTCNEATDSCSSIPDVGASCGIAGTCDSMAMCIEPPPPPVCDPDEKLVNGTCVPKTCEELNNCPPPCDEECIQDQRLDDLESRVSVLEQQPLTGVEANLDVFIIVEIVIFGITITIIVIIRTRKGN